jgi:ABC-type transport system involved in multi-copper enzyme maturation permease subunit
MGSVYALTLRQLTGRWRMIVLTVLAALPVLVTLLVLRSDSAPSVGDFEMIVYNTLLVGSITPLVVLAIATAAFGNEVDDRTLANLTLTPLPRWQIVVAKLLATLTVAAPFVGASALITSHLAFMGEWQATVAVTTGALVGVALYSSAFLWLGLVSTQAIGVGLLYVVLWEGFFAGFVAGVRLLSIRYLAMAGAHGLDARRFADLNHVGLVAVIAITALVFAGFLWLTVRHLRRMDVA